MLPNSSEKATKLKDQDSSIKRKNSNLQQKRHIRSQSSSSTSVSNEVQSSTFENNKRGWLESTSVQVNPSRSLDMRKSSSIPTTVNIKKPIITESQKDMLGAVSDEDIFKLTELTSRLPEAPGIKPPKQHRRHRTDENNITRKTNIELSDGIKNDLVTPDVPSSPLSIQNSSDTPESNEKRRSWLYKSLIKPYKKGSKSSVKSSSSDQNIDDSSNIMSPAASIADEFYRSMESEEKALPAITKVHTIGTPEGFKNKLKSQKKFSNSPFHTRSNSSHVTSNSNASNSMRRHSFDSFQSHIKEEFDKDEALEKWDQERRQERENATFGYSHEERPNFHLSISTNNIIQQQQQQDNNVNNIPLSDDEHGTTTPAIVVEDMESDIEQEDLVTFMFDYYSLPVEIKSLIDAYEHKGKAERKKMIVKYKKGNEIEVEDEDSDVDVDEAGEDDEYDDEEEDDDDDEEEEIDSKEETVDYRDLITGNCLDKKPNHRRVLRDIAIVTTSKSDNIEFTKLVQIAMDSSSSSLENNESLLDLHVSLFGDTSIESENNVQQEDFQDVIFSIEENLEKFQEFREQSANFLRDHVRTMETLNLYNDKEYIPKLQRTHSFPALKSIEVPLAEEFESISSSESSSISSDIRLDSRDLYHRNAHSMYGGNGDQFISRDPFDLRQREITSLVSSLKKDLDKFKDSLVKTEDLVRDVQVDMNDTRNRMETYIKDIPESHYSALKKLEVDIELILSKRAKNPWLDTGYALLSYLLTLFALVVWIIIYMLKWGKKVVLFPKKLWQAYSDYLVERNKAVKKASVLSLSKKERIHNDTIINEHPIFQRSNRRRDV